MEEYNEAERLEQSKQLRHDYPENWIVRSKIPRNTWLVRGSHCRSEYGTTTVLIARVNARWRQYEQR